jgi:hypothetical protein
VRIVRIVHIAHERQWIAHFHVVPDAAAFVMPETGQRGVLHDNLYKRLRERRSERTEQADKKWKVQPHCK